MSEGGKTGQNEYLGPLLEALRTGLAGRVITWGCLSRCRSTTGRTTATWCGRWGRI